MGKLKDLKKFIERKLLRGHDPDFLIIGSQKSGTTTLFDLLNTQPGLSGSWPKEMHFFSRFINEGKDLKWYRKHFTSWRKNVLFFEASPNYIFFESVAKELSKTYPSIKLILIIRDPVDRAFSAWNMYYDHFKKGKLEKRLSPSGHMYKSLMDGRTTFPTFREAIDTELDQMKNGTERGLNFLRKGLYYDQISTYLKYFKRDQLLIIGLNDLKHNAQGVVNNILDFLNASKEGMQVPPVAKTKNKRSYSSKLAKAEFEFLTEFYREPNQKLKEFLGYEINW